MSNNRTHRIQANFKQGYGGFKMTPTLDLFNQRVATFDILEALDELEGEVAANWHNQDAKAMLLSIGISCDRPNRVN